LLTTRPDFANNPPKRYTQTQMLEFVTDILDEAQWPSVLNAVVAVLKRREVQSVRVNYGYVFERDVAGQRSPDECVVAISDLGALIERGLREGTIEWNGHSDFRFAPVEIPLQLMLCNDADLHLYSADRTLLLDLSRAFSGCGVKVYECGKLVETG
jgi:hypothetical protein